jgi:hypothetical protein
MGWVNLRVFGHFRLISHAAEPLGQVSAYERLLGGKLRSRGNQGLLTKVIVALSGNKSE